MCVLWEGGVLHDVEVHAVLLRQRHDGCGVRVREALEETVGHAHRGSLFAYDQRGELIVVTYENKHLRAA